MKDMLRILGPAYCFVVAEADLLETIVERSAHVPLPLTSLDGHLYQASAVPCSDRQISSER